MLSKTEDASHEKFYSTFSTYFFYAKSSSTRPVTGRHVDRIWNILNVWICFALHIFFRDRRWYTITQLKEQRADKIIKDLRVARAEG